MSLSTPRLLVSVRDAAEAVEALAGGADWIDLKEPRRGPLGAVDAVTARDVVDVVAGRVPVSAAAGELCDWPGAAAELLDVDGFSLLKLGLAGCADRNAWPDAWRRAHERIAAAGKQLTAVIYADSIAASAPPAHSILGAAAQLSCPWVLWDTFDKAGAPLAQHISDMQLATLLFAARRHGMKSVVAGRLSPASISLLPGELIDMIGVRGAACRGSRDSTVCRECVAELRDALDAMEPQMHSRG
jgi:uncharacterized protein (UPF0264 family)